MYSLKNNGELESVIDDNYQKNYPDYDIETNKVGTIRNWFTVDFKFLYICLK